MRILIVHDYGTPSGGGEVMALALRAGLRLRGHDARLFASRAGAGGGPTLADFECAGTTSRWRTLTQTANPSAYRALRRVLASFRPDVVHVRIFLTQLSPLILPLLRDVPSLYHAVWYRAVCPLGTKLLPDGSPCRVPWGIACLRNDCLPLRDWIPLMGQMALWRRWRGVFDAVVANSESVRARLLADGIGPVEVVPNGVAERPPRPPLAGPPTAAFAGRLVPEKGVDVLLRAFARVAGRVPGARLVIAGDGPDREPLRALARELGVADRVELTGRLPRPELERRFDAAWVQAAPSLWDEPFGIVAAEAMMRGTAVVASGTGGLADVVRHGETGFLVAPGDAPGLARALEALLADRALAEAMGRAGRERALAEFRDEICVERFEAIYRRLAGNPTTGPARALSAREAGR